MPIPTATKLGIANPAEPSFWRIVSQSLRGGRNDYTVMSLHRAVLLLAVPMILEMIMESLFAIASVFWLARLGSDAVAIVGLTESVMTLIYSVAVGLAIAATAIVSRRIGEQNPERAAQASGQILVLAAMLSATVGLVFGFFADDILRLMGAQEPIVMLGGNFARIMFGCNATVFLIFVINAIFRGAGDALLAMRTLWLANALNIVLGPCLIFGWGPFPELGVTGAAVATNIGRGTGVLYQLWHLFGRPGRVHVRATHLRLVRDDVKAIMTKACNGIAQLLISTTSWIGLYIILAQFGSAALAGYTIAIRIVSCVLMPASGLANAGATLVGQNLGAGKPSRAAEAVKMATRFNVIFLGAVAAIFVILARPIIGLFTSDPETLDYGSRALWIVSLALPLYAVAICMGAAFNGAGDTWTPTRLNICCFWAGQVPIAWVLSRVLGFGAIGVFAAVALSFSVLAVWSTALFKRGDWMKQSI